MKNVLLSNRLYIHQQFSLSKIGLNFVLIAFFSIICTNSFAQKVVNHQALQEDLTAVNEKIQKIDQTIEAINSRIAGIAPENLDPSIQVRLNDLQISRDQYIREKTSIEAALNTTPNSLSPIQEDDTTDSSDNTPKTQ